MRSLRRLATYVSIVVLGIVLLLAVGYGVTQTGWFKNWVRQKAVSQAAQYLNGTLVIQRLSGSLFTGVVLEGVALQHEGQTAVAMDKLIVEYSPFTMISRGLILDSLTLERPTLVLQRTDAGWNFNRFVKARQNTSGRGAPAITMESIRVNDGHLIVRDHDRLIEDLARLNTHLRFAYLKPGIDVDLHEFSGESAGMQVRQISGEMNFDRGAIDVRDLIVETNRTQLRTVISYTGPSEKLWKVDLDASRLSLPELGRYFSPLARIHLEPVVKLTAEGPLDALRMNAEIVSSAGNARGPLVGRFGESRALEGSLEVADVNMAPILDREEWATRVTGHADFTWSFGHGAAEPMHINFRFNGPRVEGFGYRAAGVRAEGVYDPQRLTFDASGAAYGATATAKAQFRFATPRTPLSYSLAGTFRGIDMRQLPERLSMPELATAASGSYRFEASRRNWRADGVLADSVAEDARFGSGTVVAMAAQDGQLSYSASGTVADLNPRRFAQPLEVTWLNDDRLAGSLSGSFDFTGSGRSMNDLRLATTASLQNSRLGGATFPQADVSFELANREIHASFKGPFEALPGSLITSRQGLADTSLNGSADMAVTLALPADQPLSLDEVAGTANLTASKVGGLAVDTAEFSGRYADEIANIQQFTVSGPDLSGSASGTLATGDAGNSDLQYDVSVTSIEPLATRFNKPASGSARIVGRAIGPAANLELTGTIGGNRLQYGTTVDALAANSSYSVRLSNFDFETARVQADTQATFVTIAGTNLPRVSAKTTYQNNELRFESTLEEERRSLALGGDLLFHPDHNELHLRAFDLTVGQTRWSLPPGGEAVANYSADSVAIKGFVLRRGAQQLSAEGIVAIGSESSDQPNSLSVRLDNVQVQDINEILLGDRNLQGLLNATATIAGTRNNPLVESDFALTGGVAEGVAFNSLAGKANYSGRAVDVDVRLEQNPQAVLTAVGTAPISGGPGTIVRTEQFDLALKSSRIDLALFQPATTAVTNLTGQFQGDLRLKGTLEAPLLNGLAEVTNASFAVAASGVRYDNALARLTFEGERLFVDRFEISDEDRDRLVAIGELGVARRRVETMNVQVSADRFKVLDNEFGSIEVNADIRITGEADKPQVTGDIVSQSGRVEVDRLLEVISSSAYATEAMSSTTTETEQTATAPYARPTSLYAASTIDVRVSLPDDLQLRGRNMHASFSRIGLGDMNITVGGDLRIQKAPEGLPDVVGTVHVVRGFYDFQSRRFEVLRDSQIRFTGSRPIDPALQVDAQREISGVVAVVNLRGTARQPVVRLSSEPPLDEGDVLSLIIFNQPINQLGEGERVDLAERAGSLAVGYLASPLANSIARALDLDIFEIQTSGDVSGGAAVSVGQQIGARLFVSFRQVFGSDERSELSLEYRINRFLRLVTTVSEGGRASLRTQRHDPSGIDLFYVISY